MAEKVYPMTAEGKEKLQKELKNLKLVKQLKDNVSPRLR